MVRHDDIDSLIDTIGITSSPHRMKLIGKSEEDNRKGRVKD
jgi:hypothetical protein